jgi:hypothetical protein
MDVERKNFLSPTVFLQSYPPLRPIRSACSHGFPGTDSKPSHGPGLASEPSHRTTSAPAGQKALKTKIGFRYDTLRKRRWVPPRPPPKATAHWLIGDGVMMSCDG